MFYSYKIIYITYKVVLLIRIMTIWKYRTGWLWDLLLLPSSSKKQIFLPVF